MGSHRDGGRGEIRFNGIFSGQRSGWAVIEVYEDFGISAAGCTKIYREKVAGAPSDRRELLKMLHAFAPGDVGTVTRIDRLARSTFDLFGIVKRIVDAKVQFRSLAEPWANTGTSTGRLMLAVTRRPCRCGARSYPHPHRRRQEPRQGSRTAHGATPETD